ncbi:MAG: hypothetical protein EX271_06960 [Acidimicrobiales bacterium]|nr:hypothetical protein [Hyphomonadaceae bacterium]RZV41929.1 MAG: hypothetical protein EX271_06960 [Acidimicrobiales bacterium]
MGIKKWFGQAKGLGASTVSTVTKTSAVVGDVVGGVGGVLGAGIGFVGATIDGIKLFGSTENSSTYQHEKFDEKHYFLIPDFTSEYEYSLYIMRCLPDGVPPLNDLPKQRVLHLPDQSAMPTVHAILKADARESAEKRQQDNAVSSKIDEVVDAIDKIDEKAFQGVLLVGGLVALVNPIAGATVAVKAIVPSVGAYVSKLGLKLASETVSNIDLSNKVKAAEKQVLKQFKGSSTIEVINPVLLEFDAAVRRGERLELPLKFDAGKTSLAWEDSERFLSLTYTAICNSYEDMIKGLHLSRAQAVSPPSIYQELVKSMEL